MFPENRLMEVLIIGALALIVVGPKDLPVLMRRVGQFVGKMRGMAAEFRASFDELARQSELDELRKEVEALRRQNPLEGLNPLTEDPVAAAFREIDHGLGAQASSPARPIPLYDAAGEAARAAVAPGPAAPGLEAAPDAPAKPKRAPRKPRAPVSDAP